MSVAVLVLPGCAAVQGGLEHRTTPTILVIPNSLVLDQRALASSLRALRARVQSVFGGAVGGATKIVLYSHGEYLRAGYPAATHGLFDPAQSSIGVDTSRRDWETIALHEYSHALLCNKKLPVWLDEGFAEYFVGLVSFNGAPPRHMRIARYAFRRKDWLRRLLSMSDTGFYAQGVRERYAQAWAIVGYCLAERRDGFLRSIDAGTSRDFVMGEAENIRSWAIARTLAMRDSAGSQATLP